MKTSRVSLWLRIVAVAFLAGTWPVPALFADEPPLPLSGEILVPDTTAGDQAAPEVASNEDGDFVAVWQSFGEDGDGFGVYAQLFSEEGAEVGTPFPVNTTVTGDQNQPAVSADDSGNFAVAWQSPDAGATGIVFRYFEETGVPDTAEIPVNTTTAGAQSSPSLALAENDHVLVVWQGPDAGGTGIYGRLFDNAGVALSAEFLINTTTAGNQERPQVRPFDEDNGFFVVWEGPDANGFGIYLQRISSAGALVGGETLVNTTTAGNQRNAAVAISGIDLDGLDQNRFVVVWQSPDSAGNGIFARLYDDDGSPLGGEFLVNDDDASNQTDASVAVDNGGDNDGINFVVSFTEAPILGRGAPIFIRGRRLGGSGPPVRAIATDEFPVSVLGSTTAASTVAVEDNGDFVVLWQSDSQDGSGQGVYGRRFAGQPIFVDGFESGNTLEWSLTVP